MSIMREVEVEVASVGVTDVYGVVLYAQERPLFLSSDEARALAAELMATAVEADRLAVDDGELTIEQLRERLAASPASEVL